MDVVFDEYGINFLDTAEMYPSLSTTLTFRKVENFSRGKRTR